jgi:hypothetical protein
MGFIGLTKCLRRHKQIKKPSLASAFITNKAYFLTIRKEEKLSKRKSQTACKPGSVPTSELAIDGYSSGTPVTERLMRHTRTAARKHTCSPKPPAVPTRSCSRWGLPCRSRHRGRGALLPHPFTLTCPEGRAVYFLWHFPWGHPRRPLTGTVSPWSPDFPRSLLGTATIQPSGKSFIPRH